MAWPFLDHPPLGSTPAHQFRAVSEPLGLLFAGMYYPGTEQMTPFIAILIDGGYFLKRLSAVLGPAYDRSVAATVDALVRTCRAHVLRLVGLDKGSPSGKGWRQYVYRIFYYDAMPYVGKSEHPLTRRPIDFAHTDPARFREELFQRLRRERKVALRLGEVIRERGWHLRDQEAQRILRTKRLLETLIAEPTGAGEQVSESQSRAIGEIAALWSPIDENAVSLGLRQKGVDMRLGLDIASMALKKQARTMVLVAGDSDFVPAAKLARREGVEFILDPMWRSVRPDLFEHIDGLQSGLPRPKEPNSANTPIPTAVSGGPTGTTTTPSATPPQSVPDERG